MKTVNSKSKPIEVAVKLAKTTAMNKEKIKEMMKEARLMRNFDHENVVRLFGVCVDREPLMIVMELIQGGALDEYLRKTSVSIDEKVDHMTLGAAWGLEYLHGRHCIHRDVAARNCLYANQKVKISDFGMSREGEEYRQTTSQRVPIRWLSPETLATCVYTPMSDVWSFGVMVREIFDNGREPYHDMTLPEVKDAVTNGYKMPFPEETPPKIVDLVTEYCWAYQPTERMTMTDIVKHLEEMTGLHQQTNVSKSAGSSPPKEPQVVNPSEKRRKH
ncbi:Protein kinase domain containing protein [Aphelenchoides avenae]|nr:Protein kinase domain containing protein [Aphelenchus avenae]